MDANDDPWEKLAELLKLGTASRCPLQTLEQGWQAPATDLSFVLQHGE